MTTLISRRSAVLLIAAAFLVCAVLGFTKEVHAQPPPCDTCNCWNCLQPQIDPNPNLCDGCSEGCYTWSLLNNCSTCLDTIWLMSKFGDPFTACCAAVDSASHGTWTFRPLSSHEVMFTATSGCLDSNRFLQITTCGLTPGEDIYLYWVPGEGPDPPCDTTGKQPFFTHVP
jgi:hypothetical protein